MIKKVQAELVSFVKYLIQFSFWVIPLKKNRVVFVSYYGKFYNDNPKAISDKLKGKGLDMVWLVNDPNQYNDSEVRFVRYGSLRSIFYLATSILWVDNCRKELWVRKRAGQKYIQCWHGSIGIKACEKDAEHELSWLYLKRAKLDGKHTDIMISNGDWCTKLYKRAFWTKAKILEYGSPRMDYIVNGEVDADEVRRKLNMQNKRAILYVPTFRNDYSLDIYRFNYEQILSDMNKKYGGEWVFLLRLHPNFMSVSNADIEEIGVINVTTYPNIYDLIYVSEFIITDYSSAGFESSVIQKNLLIYAPDVESYKKERSLYFDFEKLPFPYADSYDKLRRNLVEFDRDEYLKKLKIYINELGVVENGHASKRTADYILNVLMK